MSEIQTATSGDSLIALKERKRLLDDVWLLTLFVVLVAIGLPWYLRILEIDLAPVAWSLFAYGLAYLAVALAADRLRTRRSSLIVIAALQGTGVVFLGLLWHLAGGLQNPMFLVVFVLPVVASGLVLLSWHSYGTALLSIGTVAGVALIDTPELRWYVAQTGSLGKRLIDALPAVAATTRQPFPSLTTPPSYLFVLLLSFAVLLCTVALMTESLTSLLARLYGRIESSTAALNRAESLFLEVLRASPSPAALVYADTLNVAQASQSFMHQLFLGPESLREKNLFGLIDFSYPEVVEELITRNGGEVPVAVYRIDGETRVAKVQVHPIHHDGVRYAYLNLHDISTLHYVQAALNAVEEALMVINPSRHLVHFNQAARDLLGDLRLGMDAATLFGLAALPEGWWELGSRSRQQRQLEFRGKSYRANCVAARILGQPETLTVVSLRPLGTPE